MDRRRFALLALSFAGACAPFAPRSSPPLIAPDSLVQSKRQMAAVAFERLQRALDSKDSIAVALNLHPEVELITPTNDTLYGASAWRYIMFLVSDSTKNVKLGRGKFEPCLEGDVYQFNGDFRPRGTPIQVTGRFGILWATDERPVVARRIALSYTRSSLRKRLSCQPEFHVASAQHRFTGTVGPVVHPFATSASARGVARSMNANGLSYRTTALNMTGPGANPFPQVQQARLGISAGMRYRSERVYSRELQFDLALPETVRGFDASTNRYVEATAWHSGAALLLQYQRRPYRFGVGPSGRLARWMVHEEQRTIDSMETFEDTPIGRVRTVQTYWGKAPGSPESTVRSWSPSMGAVFEIARLMPITRRRAGELLLRGGLFTNSQVPSTPGFSGASVANRFLTVGASIGTGWK